MSRKNTREIELAFSKTEIQIGKPMWKFIEEESSK